MLPGLAPTLGEGFACSAYSTLVQEPAARSRAGATQSRRAESSDIMGDDAIEAVESGGHNPLAGAGESRGAERPTL